MSIRRDVKRLAIKWKKCSDYSAISNIKITTRCWSNKMTLFSRWICEIICGRCWTIIVGGSKFLALAFVRKLPDPFFQNGNACGWLAITGQLLMLVTDLYEHRFLALMELVSTTLLHVHGILVQVKSRKTLALLTTQTAAFVKDLIWWEITSQTQK